MFYKHKLTDDLYYVGGNDRRLSRFENMFALPEGVSYGSYILMDEKTALFDGIDAAVSEYYYEAVRRTLDGRPLDYFVVHHVEPDHCTTIAAILAEHPECKLVTSAKGLTFLKQFYPETHDFGVDFEACAVIVSEGDTLSLGKHELTFIAAPNVHWPEVMMSYEKTDKILFSADAFGSFKAIEGHLFADQVDFERDWLNEFRRYYLNIVGRQGASVQRVLKKAADLDIQMICSLHGLVFRTPELIKLVMEKYDKWSSYTPEEDGIVLVYSSMYGDNMVVVDTLAFMLSERGVKNIRVHDVSESDVSIIIADLFRFSHALFTGMNYNTELYPRMDALLREIKMLNYSNRKVSYIGAMSWGGRGLAIAQEILGSCKGIEQVGEPVIVKSALPNHDLDKLAKLADEIAASFN